MSGREDPVDYPFLSVNASTVFAISVLLECVALSIGVGDLLDGEISEGVLMGNVVTALLVIGSGLFFVKRMAPYDY